MTPFPRTRLLLALRPLFAFALGAAVPWGCDRALLAASAPWEPGPPSVWVADRDAGRLVALDSELYVRAAVTLAAPIQVGADARGGAWALDLVERRSDGALRLARIDRDGAIRATRTLIAAGEPARAAPPDLFVAPGGDAAVCVPEGEGEPIARVLCLRGDGAEAARLAIPGARAVAQRGRRVLVGGANGVLREFELAAERPRSPPDPAGAEPDRGESAAMLVGLGDAGAAVLDVAPAAGGRGPAWWVLMPGSRVSTRRVALVEGFELRALWSVELEVEVDALAAVPTPRGRDPAVWLVARTSARVWRVHAFRPATGADEIAGLPLGGFGAGSARAEGGLLLPAPGALLELDPAGGLVRSQGGFDFLVAAACVPGEAG